MDGKLDDWSAGTRWQEIGDAGIAAVTVSGDWLYAAFKTSDPRLLDNDAVNPTFMFKNGGCIDLMIGTDASADRKRTSPVKGDLPLLVAKVKGRAVAMRYRAVVPGTEEKDRVLFESPIGKVWLDRVDDISGLLQLAQDGGNAEFSMPLSALSFSPQAGESVLADFGILRGNGAQTIQRLYWNNLNTSIVSDIPSEAGFSRPTGDSGASAPTTPNCASLILRRSRRSAPACTMTCSSPLRILKAGSRISRRCSRPRTERLTPLSSRPKPRNSRAFYSPVTSPFPRTGYTPSTCGRTRKAVFTSATERSCKETATKPSPRTVTFS